MFGIFVFSKNSPMSQNNNQEYKRSLEDEIIWKDIDQLHAATNNFSSKSLEIRKIYFTLIGIGVPTIYKINNNNFEEVILLFLFGLTLLFWLLDSQTYYYQKKLRFKINENFIKLRSNNNNNNNNNESEKQSIRKALFNGSQWMYYIGLLACLYLLFPKYYSIAFIIFLCLAIYIFVILRSIRSSLQQHLL